MIISILLVVAGIMVLCLLSVYSVRRILRTTPRNPGTSLNVFSVGSLFGSPPNLTPEEQARFSEDWKDRFANAPVPRKLLFVTLCSGNFTLMFMLASKQKPVPYYLDTYTPLSLLAICLLWVISLFVLSIGRKLDPRSYDLTTAAAVGWWACFAIELVFMLALVFRV